MKQALYWQVIGQSHSIVTAPFTLYPRDKMIQIYLNPLTWITSSFSFCKLKKHLLKDMTRNCIQLTLSQKIKFWTWITLPLCHSIHILPFYYFYYFSIFNP